MRAIEKMLLLRAGAELAAALSRSELIVLDEARPFPPPLLRHSLEIDAPIRDQIVIEPKGTKAKFKRPRGRNPPRSKPKSPSLERLLRK